MLRYFGLDCGLFEFFKYSTHEPSSKRKLFAFRRFLETGSLKELGWRTTKPTAKKVGGLEVFLY